MKCQQKINDKYLGRALLIYILNSFASSSLRAVCLASSLLYYTFLVQAGESCFIWSICSAYRSYVLLSADLYFYGVNIQRKYCSLSGKGYRCLLQLRHLAEVLLAGEESIFYQSALCLSAFVSYNCLGLEFYLPQLHKYQ